jgi:hypothetical protein
MKWQKSTKELMKHNRAQAHNRNGEIKASQ